MGARWQGFGNVNSMNVGAELREARLRAGLSREEVSQRTKIQLAKIEALEANAFERLPEGIYLDGLIRAFATEVGLDGSELVAGMRRPPAVPLDDDAVVDERVFPSERALAHRDDDDLPPVVQVTTPQAVDATDYDEYAAHDRTDYMVPPAASTAYEADDLGYAAAPPGYAPAPGFLAGEPAAHRRGAARYVLPILAVLLAIAAGAYLYDRNRPFVEREDIAAPAIAHDNTAATATDAANASLPASGGNDVVPADRPASSEHHGAKPLEEPIAPTPSAAVPPPAVATRTGGTSPSRTSGSPAGNAAIPGAVASSGASTTSTSNAPTSAAADAPADAASTPAAPASDAPSAPTSLTAPDLSGYWTLDTRIESSSMHSYEGLQLGYRLELQQSGGRITGQGIKTRENGREIGQSAQTPISVQGSLDGRRLTLTFTEVGRQRESGGKMILDVNEDGVLRGRFSSSAARSSGTAEARRPEG
jgi:transcriptional regulator with XRE-family HTH domain